MLTQQESPAAAAASGASSKLRRLVRKRLRQLLRVVLVATIGLALAAGAFAIWWLRSLDGLPDIGEPFDLDAFRAFRVPDEQNAFTFLRQASEALTPAPVPGRGPTPTDATFSWSIADPRLREWAEANRRALALFQRGADQPDAAQSDMAGNPTAYPIDHHLNWVAYLEASRREESGDAEGAWNCYRSVLRMITHIGRRGSLTQRYHAIPESLWLHQRLATWAANPRTTIPLLRASLEEALKSEPKPDWDTFAMKAGYLEMERALERPLPHFLQEELEGEWSARLGDLSLSPAMVASIEAMRRFVWREPERSRRVLRLLGANYVAHAETHSLSNQKPVAWASFSVPTSTNRNWRGTISVPLYAFGPEAPLRARAMAPQELASWLIATHDARLRVMWSKDSDWPWPPDFFAQRKAHRDLVIMLASELYRRERGALPTTDEALVGTYLNHLPDDGSNELDDGSAPRIQ